MALTVVGSSSSAWAAVAATTQEISPNAGVAVDDRVFILSAWKDFSVTATCADRDTPALTYTEVTEFADGAVAAGNNVGSMKVGAWYKEWTSSDVIPLVTWSSITNVGASNMLVLRKSASETWDTPLFATAAWPVTANPQTISASSTVAVPSGGVVMAIIGIRDDSATFTRGATTGIDVASGITWAANYVEEPAAHLSSLTGGDMAADLGYRLVTTGGTVTLRVTATLSAVETGSILWIAQGVTAAAERVPKYQPMIQLLAH